MPPRVDALEPPSWWRGSTYRPIRLLVRGDGLSGARVSVEGPGVRVGPPRITGGGKYLFVDLEIEAKAAPGPRRVILTTADGAASAAFTVLAAPAARKGGVGPDDILYLIMPDRFCDGDPAGNDPPKSRGLYDPKRPRHYHGGDLAGIRRRLPYLKELGVTALWLTPLYDNADRVHPTLIYGGEPAIDYHGYGAVDLWRIDEHLGDFAALRALVQDAHAAGMKVVQDQVANHVGPLHPWVDAPPTRTWLHPRKPCIWRIADTLSPHAARSLRAQTVDGWFAGILPDLNQDDPECARHLIQNALWWVGVAGFDGIRQDTVPYVPRTFWRDWSAALRREFPDLSLLGEVNIPDPTLCAFFQTGRAGWDGIDAGFDQVYDFPLQAALWRVFGGGAPLSELADVLAHDPLYPDPSRLVTFVGLHDLPRISGRLSAWSLPLAVAFLFATRGIPLWYYGDELALAGGDDPDNRRHFPGGFPGDGRDAFTPAGRSAAEQALWACVQGWMRLRRESAVLRHGETRFVHVDARRLAWVRGSGEGALLIALNIEPRPASLTIAELGRFSVPARSAAL